MAQWNENIDGEHLRIASHQGSTMRVLAGPGTGKSYALQRKVMRLLQEGTEPARILAVTFTNVAADALKKDLSSLEVAGAEQVKARTLHSLCFEVLQREHVFEFTGRTPRPLMDFETQFLLEDMQSAFGGKKKTKALLQAYESAFARQQQDLPGVIQSADDLRFKRDLLEWLNLHKTMLIGELIPITYEYLKANPTAPEFDQYDFILVDEYQDLNKAEQALIDMLARKAELLVVGDDDQSIYSFKHAHPAGIIEFHTTHAPIEDVSLQICRRCPKGVVRLANELMGYLLGSNHPKELKEFPGNGEGTIYATQWESVDAETIGVAKIIKKLTSDANYCVNAEDILILSPRRQLAYALRDALYSTYAINSHTFFQEEALESQKAQTAYAYFNYLVDPDDRVAFRVLLGIPTSLPGTYKKLCEIAARRNTTPKGALLLVQQSVESLPRCEELLERLQTLETVVQELKGQRVEVVLKRLLNAETPEDIESLLSILSTLTIAKETTLREVFSKIQERILSPEVTDEAGYVRIMSLHKSKGLTAKAVVILGCVAGLIPTIKDEEELLATNQAELERLRAEAKRLFFVALTRTTNLLILSSFRDIEFARALRLGGTKIIAVKGSRKARTQASPFFSEVSKHLPRVITGPELLSKFNITE